MIGRMLTCGECPHKEFRQVGPKGYLPGVWVCMHSPEDPENPRLVPQNTDREKSVFLRVPEWCPLPEDQAEKRGHEHWQHPLNRTVIPREPR